jgi:hypothetical protein
MTISEETTMPTIVPTLPISQADKTKPQLVWMPDEQRKAIVYWVVGLNKWIEMVGGPDQPQVYYDIDLSTPPAT